MILQQLEKDYERILRFSVLEEEEDELEDLAPPSMYVEKPVRWCIVLRPDGTYRDCQPLSGGEGKKDRGKPLPVPFVVRTVNISPLLLADTPAYVLGIGEDKRAPAKHEAFRALVKRCAEETGNASVQAISAFLDRWNATPEAERPQLPAGIEPGDTVMFEVGSDWPIEAPEVRAFWAQNCQETAKTSAPMQCLICGNVKPAVESMPVLVKGIPGGQTSGTALVSANSDIFESYGWQRATTSPICAKCAERFGKALNALLAGPNTHKRVGVGLVYVFWTAEGPYRAGAQTSNPEPGFVKALMDSVRSKEAHILDDPTPFYGLALSATASRAVVRDWLTTTVGNVNRNIARWFEAQEITDPYGQPWRPIGDWRLAQSLYRRGDEVEARVSDLIVRSAFHGEPLPDDLLYRAVARNRVEQNVTYERAALITLMFESQKWQNQETLEKEGQPLTQALEEKTLQADEQAKLCGRLLAVLEELQRVQADTKINTTLVDRFYGAASTSPGSVFGNLLKGAQPHLTKLRKKNEGAYYGIQRQLEEIQEQLYALGSFPTTLSMKRQALFALGYYHQRAEQRRAGMEAAQRKRAQAGQTGGDDNGNSRNTD